MADEPQKLEIVDNPSVGELYANKLIAASFDGGAVVITLGTARVLPESGSKPPKTGNLPPVYVTARVALSPTAAVELSNALAAMLKRLGEIQKKAAAKPN